MTYLFSKIFMLTFMLILCSCNSGGGGSSTDLNGEGEGGGDENTSDTAFRLSGSVVNGQTVSKLEIEIYKYAFQGSFQSLPDEVINLEQAPLAADLVSNPTLATSSELVSGFSTFAIEISRTIRFIPINPPSGAGNCQDGVEATHFLGFEGTDEEITNSITAANTIEFNRGNDWRTWWETKLIEDQSTLLGPNSDRLAIYFRNFDPYSITRLDRRLDLARSNFGMSAMPLFSSASRGLAQNAVFTSQDKSRGKLVFSFLDPADAIDNSVSGKCLLKNFIISLESE